MATMIDNSDLVTESQFDSWVRDFNSWDICDVRMRLDKPTVDKRKKWDRVFLCK